MLPLPRAVAGRECFLLCEARGGQGNDVLDKRSVSSCPLAPPRCPRASGPGRTHTTALFTSTPLLLCEVVMGYSETLVPFSSFLRGFLGAGGGAGAVRGEEGHR